VDGKLVSVRTWELFWLNEGFTRFAETKIMTRHQGRAVAHLKVNEGMKALADSVEHFGEGHDFTRLIPPLQDKDPDDSFSSIPYEKGMSLLWYLQELVGGDEPMEAFLKAYIMYFRRKVLTSQDFQRFFLGYFEERVPTAALDSIDWERWFNAAGMPPSVPTYDTSLREDAAELAKRWMGTADGGAAPSAGDLEGLQPEQFVVMLDELLTVAKTLPAEKIAEMEALCVMNARKNSEIRFRWQRLAIASHWAPIYPHATEFLLSMRSMKFTRPLYRALFGGGPEAREVALKTFKKGRGQLHPIAAKMVAKDMQLS